MMRLKTRMFLLFVRIFAKIKQNSKNSNKKRKKL